MGGASELSQPALFLWGGVGGAAAGFAAYTLPWLVDLSKGGAPPRFWEAVGGTGLLVGYGFLGGVAALLVGSATASKQAIAYGLVWPAVFTGVSQTTKAFADRGEPSRDGMPGSD